MNGRQQRPPAAGPARPCSLRHTPMQARRLVSAPAPRTAPRAASGPPPATRTPTPAPAARRRPRRPAAPARAAPGAPRVRALAQPRSARGDTQPVLRRLCGEGFDVYTPVYMVQGLCSSRLRDTRDMQWRKRARGFTPNSLSNAWRLGTEAWQGAGAQRAAEPSCKAQRWQLYAKRAEAGTP